MRVLFGAVMAACLQAAVQGEVVSTFTAGDGSWHLGTLATANLDSNPDLEIVIPYRSVTGWYLDAFKYHGQRLAGFPYFAGGDPLNVSPAIADLDNDGRDEIIITRANSVVALRSNGKVLWSNAVTPDNYLPDGGFHTITNGFYWSSTASFLPRLPSTASFSSEVSPPMAVDLAGNGKYEVLTAWKIDPDPNSADQDYNPFIYETYGVGHWGLMGETWSGSVISFDARTGGRTFAYHLHHLVESGLAVGRAQRSGPLHVYELNDSDGVVAFDKSKPFGLWGKGMLHRQFGKNQRLMSGCYQYPVDIQTADVDGDGLDEVLVPGIQISELGWQPNETILDDDGSILWRRWLPKANVVNNAGWNNSASMIPCNPDRDNRVDVLGWHHGYEISFRTWNGTELADRPGWPKNFFPMLPTPPIVGDVDGDGAEEIVIGTYNPAVPALNGALNVYSLDGTLETAVPIVGGVKHIPALADVRGNGRRDLVVRSTLGVVSVLDLGGRSSNSVSWATHRGNMRRDGNLGVSLYPAGTPLVTSKTSGTSQTSFTWTNSTQALSYSIYRADSAEGPYQKIASVNGQTFAFTDRDLQSGVEYYYEIAAEYSGKSARSAPFAVLSLLNGNLLSNSGFEECDNSHWDKWYTGTLGMTNMTVSTESAYQGRRSMRLLLNEQGSSGSIAQFNQYGIPDSTLYVTPSSIYSFGGFIRSGGLSQNSEHWLQWGSAKTGHDINNRPALPWPYFFTAPVVLGTSPSDWVYMNRTFRLPAGFPNLEMFHNFNMAAPGNGSIFLDNVFFRKIPDPQDSRWINLVPFGANWKYHVDQPPANWHTSAFADSAWPTGKAKFGGGGGPTNVSTRLPILKPAYYFRTRFVAPAGQIEELLLSATCTDDSGAQLFPLQLFINGIGINSTLDVVTSQGNDTRYFDLTPFAHLIQPGTNVIAAKIGNYWADWDDVAFDVRIQAMAGQPVASKIAISCANPAAPVLTFNTPTGAAWRLQSKDENGPWLTVQTGTNTTGDAQTVADVGQNGRTAPGKSRCRLYRVVPN